MLRPLGLALAATTIGFVLPRTAQAATCGDGVLSSGEECDDGNLFSGDGCSDTCTVEPHYQASTLIPGLVCYDVSAIVCDANADCEPGRVCDHSGCTPSQCYGCDICTPDCHGECTGDVCGNHTLNLRESCDDGNRVSGDGCTANCQLEHGYCSTASGAVQARSGPALCLGQADCAAGQLCDTTHCGQVCTCTVGQGWVCSSSCRAVCVDAVSAPRSVPATSVASLTALIGLLLAAGVLAWWRAPRGPARRSAGILTGRDLRHWTGRTDPASPGRGRGPGRSPRANRDAFGVVADSSAWSW
jgi:cysteine-rich repeat protein